MAKTPLDPTDFALEDPSVSGPQTNRIIKKATVTSCGLGGPDLWPRAKNMTRADLMSLAGFGPSTFFNDWTVEELDRLKRAMEAHNGITYGRGLYICCTCA